MNHYLSATASSKQKLSNTSLQFPSRFNNKSQAFREEDGNEKLTIGNEQDRRTPQTTNQLQFGSIHHFEPVQNTIIYKGSTKVNKNTHGRIFGNDGLSPTEIPQSHHPNTQKNLSYGVDDYCQQQQQYTLPQSKPIYLASDPTDPVIEETHSRIFGSTDQKKRIVTEGETTSDRLFGGYQKTGERTNTPRRSRPDTHHRVFGNYQEQILERPSSSSETHNRLFGDHIQQSKSIANRFFQ